ncbi:MAG: hypothetical protein ABJN84_12160 [Flavobacteriaceae bacterium]
MNKSIVILLFALTTLTGCTKNEFVFLIERPSDSELSNLPLILYVDDAKVYSENLEITNIASIYNETTVPASNKSDTLKVEIDGSVIEYPIEYPKDKYIIISPVYNDGKILSAILRSDKKFNLQ